MSRNTEIKIRLADVTRFNEIRERMGSLGKIEVLYQRDTYYPSTNSMLRIKMRSIGKLENMYTQHEFIVYARSSDEDCRMSGYSTTPVVDVVQYTTKLLQEYGPPEVVVRKVRDVIIVGQTRVHLDRVEGLVNPFFLELEVMLRTEQTNEEGQKIVQQVLDMLGINQEERTKQVERGSYREMLMKR